MASIAKLGRNENVNTDILLKICVALKCDIEDILEIVPDLSLIHISIIQGDPGEGKTTVVLQIIANLTKGEAILSETSEGKSEETGVEPINVIYQTAEDGLGDTCLLYTSRCV